MHTSYLCSSFSLKMQRRFRFHCHMNLDFHFHLSDSGTFLHTTTMQLRIYKCLKKWTTLKHRLHEWIISETYLISLCIISLEMQRRSWFCHLNVFFQIPQVPQPAYEDFRLSIFVKYQLLRFAKLQVFRIQNQTSYLCSSFSLKMQRRFKLCFNWNLFGLLQFSTRHKSANEY